MDLEVDSLVAGEEGSAKFGTILDGFAICASRECLFFIILLFTLETAIFFTDSWENSQFSKVCFVDY